MTSRASLFRGMLRSPAWPSAAPGPLALRGDHFPHRHGASAHAPLRIALAPGQWNDASAIDPRAEREACRPDAEECPSCTPGSGP